FLQDANDLFLAEPAALHKSVSVDGGLYPNLEEFSGLRSPRGDDMQFLGIWNHHSTRPFKT
ncbi:hypothetical protein, partial [Magnetospirillum sp. 64-120]|uniref:hypothetical protein n=1 Tax=Magnetospirillum sp. 64-120 TaxID=1895778 RepID=UPI0025BC4A30